MASSETSVKASPNRRVTTIIIGAGHAGLAMSRCLTERSIDHVLLERGEIANTWKTERWDTLTLLTPNWMSRLPGYVYEGGDPDGYRSLPETIAFIDGYAQSISAPVQTDTAVTSVRRSESGYRVATNQGGTASEKSRMIQPLIGNPLSPSRGKLSRRGGSSGHTSEHPARSSATTAAAHEPCSFARSAGFESDIGI